LQKYPLANISKTLFDVIIQGLVINGAKVYVCGLSRDPIQQVALELNKLEGNSGGTAIR
jgi:hypothetical protein